MKQWRARILKAIRDKRPKRTRQLRLNKKQQKMRWVDANFVHHGPAFTRAEIIRARRYARMIMIDLTPALP